MYKYHKWYHFIEKIFDEHSQCYYQISREKEKNNYKKYNFDMIYDMITK